MRSPMTLLLQLIQDLRSAQQEAAALVTAVAEAAADRSELSCRLAETQVCHWLSC